MRPRGRDRARHGAVRVGTLLVLAPLLLVAGFALGRWSAPPGAGLPPPPGEPPYRVTAPATLSAGAATAPATIPVQNQRFDPGPQELIPLPGGPGRGQGPGQGQGQGQLPGQGQAPAPGQGQAQGQGDCMLFMFRDGRLFQFGGPGMPGAPGTQPSPFGFGGPGSGPGSGPGFGPGGPQELYPLQPAPSPGMPAPSFPPPNFPPQIPSAPMPPPSMSQAPRPPGGALLPPRPLPSAALLPRPAAEHATPPTNLPANETSAHSGEGRS